MKAREIKKALIQERDNAIKEYNDILKHKAIAIEASAVKLRQLNHILLTYFNVDTKYSKAKDEVEPEVDDVPF